MGRELNGHDTLTGNLCSHACLGELEWSRLLEELEWSRLPEELEWSRLLGELEWSRMRRSHLHGKLV